jgi:hypothetical protein
MKFYIAGRYQRREEFQTYAKRLEELGKQFGKDVKCIARWLIESPFTKTKSQEILEDKVDIMHSDHVFFITEKPDIGYYTGGRHTELGIVIGLNIAFESLSTKHIHYSIVGPVEQDFMHDACSYFEDWDDTIIQLGKEWKAEAHAKQTTTQVTGLN